MKKRLLAIGAELRAHAPFTGFGAATGIVCMLIFAQVGREVNHRLFQVFHPGHVVLSAMVTASLFKLYAKKTSILAVLVVGYVGAIGVATLSDCVLPFFGESLLGVALPSHGALHDHADEADPDAEHGLDPDVNDEHDHQAGPAHDDDSHQHAAGEPHAHGADPGSFRSRIHLGFIEDWYLVNPAALLGVLIAYLWPRTKFPHAGHVLISTWASSFHVLMNTHRELTPVMFLGIFIVLFIAVWLPCCVSDIIFPLLFVRSPHVPLRCRHDAVEASP